MNKKLFTIGLPLVMVICIFIGAPTLAMGDDLPGTLTITGIPAEYAEKFFESNMRNIPDPKKVIDSAKTIARSYKNVNTKEYVQVINGEVKLPVYNFKMSGDSNGYTGNDTLDVVLKIYDSNDQNNANVLLSVLLSSVKFENGVAAAKWDDALKPGIIIVNNIPEKPYNETHDIFSGSSAHTIVGKGTKKVPVLGLVFNTTIADGYNNINNGTAIVQVLPLRNKTGYDPFPQNDTVDIIVNLGVPPEPGKVVGSVHVFLFKNVQISDGKAVLDLRRGVRQ